MTQVSEGGCGLPGFLLEKNFMEDGDEIIRSPWPRVPIPEGGFKPEQAWTVVGMERQAPQALGDIQFPITTGHGRQLTSVEVDQLYKRRLADRPKH